MAALQFQVELVMAPRGLVIARALQPTSFSLIDASRLAGCPLSARRPDLPKPKNPDGSPRTDVHAFLLEDPSDAQHFKPGERVELTEWREG
ncbi:MAG: hypothetical protein QM765_22745 [Myxococcales bacterium]